MNKEQLNSMTEVVSEFTQNIFEPVFKLKLAEWLKEQKKSDRTDFLAIKLGGEVLVVSNVHTERFPIKVMTEIIEKIGSEYVVLFYTEPMKAVRLLVDTIDQLDFEFTQGGKH